MRWLVGLLVAVTVSLVGVPVAGATTVGWATVVSGRYDNVGQGIHRLFDTRAGDGVAAHAARGGLSVTLSGGPAGDEVDMNFAAPAGQDLTPGVYEGAQRSAFRAAGRPGIEIVG